MARGGPAFESGLARHLARFKEMNAMTLPRRAFLHLVAGTAALPIASPVAVLGQGTMTPPGAVRIVERTQYYAKPGLAAEVLEVRRKASAVRVSIGLPAGEIFVKHAGGDGSEPDVAWQCTFSDLAAAMRTSRRAPQARNSKAFACR
jgi:hypothetical protein